MFKTIFKLHGVVCFCSFVLVAFSVLLFCIEKDTEPEFRGVFCISLVESTSLFIDLTSWILVNVLSLTNSILVFLLLPSLKVTLDFEEFLCLYFRKLFLSLISRLLVIGEIFGQAPEKNAINCIKLVKRFFKNIFK